MRITDDKYSHELHNLRVALRLVKHEARTQTICRFTGLTDDRVRKLYRTYFEDQGLSKDVRRHRGKSPQQLDALMRNAQTHMHSTVLAGALVSVELLPKQTDGKSIFDAKTAEKLCDAYDLYLHLVDEVELSFEHAYFLLETLIADSDLALENCDHCASLVLNDRYGGRAKPCPWCRTRPSRH